MTGDVLLCHGRQLGLYTLNADILLEQDVCVAAGGSSNGATDDQVMSCAFYEGTGGNEWLERSIILTGHKRGVVNVRI